MKTRTHLCVIALAIPVAVAAALWFRSSLNTARRPAREIRALEVGDELRNTTNSTRLVGSSPEFTADLASLLGQMTWNLIDRSPPPDPPAVVRLILTNDHGQALHLRLQDEFPSERLRLLSYRRIAEPDSAANRSQPVRPETNSTSAAAGSGR
jgi:hypothetical protein